MAIAKDKLVNSENHPAMQRYAQSIAAIDRLIERRKEELRPQVEAQVKDRMADPTSDRVLEVLIVAVERGGSIVREILEDLVVATTKDLKVLDEIDTEGLEMRINARAVLLLPWFVLVALTVRTGPFRDFYRSGAGVLVIGAAGVMSIVGSWWLARLGVPPSEPRVFAGSSSTSRTTGAVR